MRWATLPTSGRGPLDPPATAMDRWPVGYPLPGNTHPIRGPEVTYPWEQSRLYVTKRTLMLVCREWETLAAEYMYESLVVELFGVGNERKLLTSLRTTKRGERFRRWVKRVDASRHIHSALARVCRDGLPNAHIQHLWRGGNHMSPMEEVPQTRFSTTFQPHTLSICSHHFHIACPSAIQPRHITLYLLGADINLPRDSPMHLPNLRHLSIITVLPLNRVSETFATITKFWKCPVLTQLCINVWSSRSLECLSVIPNLVSCFRKPLRHLEILAPTTVSTLHAILHTAPDITSLIISTPLTMTLWMGNQLRHSNLQTVGLGIHCPNSWTLISDLSDREAFPNLSLVRIVTPMTRLTKPSLQSLPESLCLRAIQLLRHGIKLEDCTGADLSSVFAPPDSPN